nr:hypothetical protein [uncultured Acetatifactor sp.]
MRRVPEAAGEALDRIKKYGDEGCTLSVLFEGLSEFCASAPKPVVLLIDEVDSASNNQVFLDFLALLRGYYLQREDFPTFQSVILAGVYDIRNLKQKVRPDLEHKHNSPWNIAASFDVNMDLEADGIAGMLAEYEADYHTGMDVRRMAQLLYEETCGYPFLVSRLCQLMDEQIPGSGEFPDRQAAWSREGLLAAEKILLMEKNTLFDSLTNKLEDYPKLRELFYSMLFLGERVVYNSHNDIIQLASMFGFVKNVDGAMAVANRIFEAVLYNLFLSEEEVSNRTFSAAGKCGLHCGESHETFVPACREISGSTACIRHENGGFSWGTGAALLAGIRVALAGGAYPPLPCQ